jgi:hypothetical protein
MPGIVITDNQDLTKLSKREMCVYDTGCCSVLSLLIRLGKTIPAFPTGNSTNWSGLKIQ